ncbi:MAG TPA: ABC transporter permease [Candidatus Saccharimonas sp.]|nr:ABC transporter permease [Candidatus Saccharimonas sp.]
MTRQRTLRSFWSLTVASTKMYFRNRIAIFFTMFIPLAFIGVFGLLSKSGGPTIKLNINDHANTQLSQSFVSSVKGISTFKVSTNDQATALDQLGKNKLDLEVVIPGSFGQAGTTGPGLEPSQINIFYNKAQPSNGQAAGLILGQIVTSLNDKVTNNKHVYTIHGEGVKTNDLGAIDFILPGILGISIMQLGIFSVAFAFVSMKSTGMLRRIQATPTHPMQFVLAQGITRLLVGIIQVVLLTGLGVWLFNFHLVGSPLEFLLVALLGTIVFVALGFVVAGIAKDENQAAPIANLISFPMMFLSGTFFPRDSFPHWLQVITDYFPLTYLADALRRIANEGAHIFQLGGDLIGLTVWGIIIFAIAVKSFRWE